MSVFETLSKINVSEHIEKKNGLSYLSWAWAWAELKKVYPNAIYTVYENAECLNYHHDNKTGWVKVGVTVEDHEIIEYLPIMDYRNKSIPVDAITSMDVTKAIQRCATKAIGRHGLGLYIYAGEDLPEANNEELERQKELAKWRQETGKILIERKDNDVNDIEIKNSIKKHLGVNTLGECNDINKLKDFYAHQANKLIEDKQKKGE